MPDIDPAALSRPSISSSTPILPPKSLTIVPPPSNSSTAKTMSSKTEKIPPRIDLEPLYVSLKNEVGERWREYSEAVSRFVMGKINQSELSTIINPILDPSPPPPGATSSATSAHQSEPGAALRAHNQLMTAMYANSTREVPDHVVATWVSANDKPVSGQGTKAISGDAAEQRRKAEVMALPNRDRRRLKDISLNDPEPVDLYTNLLADVRRLPKIKNDPIVPASAGGLSSMSGGVGIAVPNLSMEIRKRYAQPLASESGEFPDASTIESRMVPICYETGLVGGASGDASQFLSVATETFIKQFLSSVFDKTRCNGPGSAGASGAGGAAAWVSLSEYRRQLEVEEEGWAQGRVMRDKSGLLPVEAKAAGERGALGMADLRMALEIGDCGLGGMRTVELDIMSKFREGELEAWDDFSTLEGYEHILERDEAGDTVMRGMESPTLAKAKVNGVNSKRKASDEDVEMEDWGWEGASLQDRESLDDLLDSILA